VGMVDETGLSPNFPRFPDNYQTSGCKIDSFFSKVPRVNPIRWERNSNYVDA
jgi:hypothetical protein